MANKKTKKPMANKVNPDGTPFEKFKIWNGRKVKRCQRANNKGEKKGYQCPQNAVGDSTVCHMHGGGTKKRVKQGTRQPPGRPPVTGDYSQNYRSVNLLEALELPLDARGKDLSLELRLLRLTTAKVLQFEPDLPKLKAELEKLLAKGDLEYDEAMDALKMIFRVEGYMQRIQEMAVNTAKVAKAMADIENSNAQIKALEQFKKCMLVFRGAIRDTLEYDQHVAIWTRVEDDLRQIRVILPKEKAKDE